ncbi:uncharacterized protein LOC110975057 isoform X2 [Acanthaster planci]|uniref:Uncharacterized protein LOC110975057 isoform X2 n=1 Tax=Acanthaster planci TaxID=133434 RepID=A0A8B7XSB9_ACAPL|nr:uncharacterized protein LOC110975057 isoform X2 [Acanthaster planci]
MEIIVDAAQDVNDKTFVAKMETDLEKLYLDGKQNLNRKRRSPREATSMVDQRQLRNAEHMRSARYRRATDPVDVVITYIQRQTADPANVDVEFYLSENGTVKEPIAASQVYSSLSLAAMSAEMGVEVTSRPKPLVPPDLPTPAPDHPYPVPGVQTDDVLEVVLVVPDTDYNQSGFKMDIRNRLEELYLEGSGATRRRRESPQGRRRNIIMKSAAHQGEVLTINKPGPEKWRFVRRLSTLKTSAAGHSRQRRQSTDPGNVIDIVEYRVVRTNQEVTFSFYVIRRDQVIPGSEALAVFAKFTLQRLSLTLGFEVLEPGVLLFSTGPDYTLWIILISVLGGILLIALAIFIIYWIRLCQRKAAKTKVIEMTTMEKATGMSTEFGRLRVDIARGEVVVEETSLDKRLPVKNRANGTLPDRQRENGAVQKESAAQRQAPTKRQDAKKEDGQSDASDGSMSEQEEPLFSHVQAPPAAGGGRPLPKPPPVRFRNSVYPDAHAQLPPLKPHPLVAEYGSDSERERDPAALIIPQTWYGDLERGTPYQLSSDYERRKQRPPEKRRSLRKDKKLQEKLTRELHERQDGDKKKKDLEQVADHGDANPTSRSIKKSRSDRWKLDNLPSTDIPNKKKKSKKRKVSKHKVDVAPVEDTIASSGAQPLQTSAGTTFDTTSGNLGRTAQDVRAEMAMLLGSQPPVDNQKYGYRPTDPTQYHKLTPEELLLEQQQQQQRDLEIKTRWAMERNRLSRMLDDAFSLKMSSLQYPVSPGPPIPAYQPGVDGPNQDAYSQPEDLGSRPTTSGFSSHDYLTSTGLPATANPFSALPGSTDRLSFRNPPPLRHGYGHSLPTPQGHAPAPQAFPYSSLRGSSELPRYTVQPVYHTSPSLYAHLSPRGIDSRGRYGLYRESLSDGQRHSSRRHKHRDENTNPVGGDRAEARTSSTPRASREEELKVLRQQNDAMQKQLAEQRRDLEQVLAAVGQPQTEIV